MKKKSLLMTLAVLVTVGAICGCGQNSDGPKETAAGTSVVSEETAEKSISPETEQTETNDLAEGREVTDMAGRKVTLPASVETVFPTDPTAGIYLYTLVPDKMLGWNYELNDTEKSIIPESYHNLPNFGMGDAINYEAVIASGPSVILVVGVINDGTIDATEKLQESLGIPAVMIDNQLQATPEAYRLMGQWFGAEEKAEQLASYAERTFADIAAMEIPEEQQVRLYYGNGEDALETPIKGSDRSQFIDTAGAVNVADLEVENGSMAQISPEQLLAWDPDVIVVNGEPKSSISGKQTADKILNDPDFASLKAVKNQRVYGTPNAPFSWIDRPPGPNRLIGIRWLSGLIYPEYLDFDVDEEVCEFFRLFYHVELTDGQLTALYDGTIGQKD